MPNKKSQSSFESIEIPQSKLQSTKRVTQTPTDDIRLENPKALGGIKRIIFTAIDRVAVVVMGKDDIARYEPPFGITSDGTGDIVRRNFKKGTVIVRDHLSRIQFELPAHKIRHQFS